MANNFYLWCFAVPVILILQKTRLSPALELREYHSYCSARLTCLEVYGLLIPRTSFKTANTGASDKKSGILLWDGAEIVVLDNENGNVRQEIGHFTEGRCLKRGYG